MRLLSISDGFLAKTGLCFVVLSLRGSALCACFIYVGSVFLCSSANSSNYFMTLLQMQSHANKLTELLNKCLVLKCCKRIPVFLVVQLIKSMKTLKLLCIYRKASGVCCCRINLPHRCHRLLLFLKIPLTAQTRCCAILT